MDTLQITLHDEVYDSGHAVGAIDRRRAAREVDAVKVRDRNGIRVDCSAAGRFTHRAVIVDKHERAHITEVAQIEVVQSSER